MRCWWLCTIALGCAGGSEIRTDATTPSDPTTPPTVTTPIATRTTPSPEGDVSLVEALIAGERSAEEVLAAVAASGGWPVLDGDGAWFVTTEPGGPWSVAGDFDDWSPEVMTHGDGFWWIRATVADPPEGQGYKFTSGETWIADPWARSYAYDTYGELSYVAPPADAPRLDRWPGVEGAGLRARELRVWVPAGDGPWPVLYAHDGQNLFDPQGIWGGWRLPDALAGRDPVLVVGIDNTVDRFDEYTHVPDDIGYGTPVGGKGDDYAMLVHEVVRPLVEGAYGSTGLDGVMGSSLGGLISLDVAWRYPGEYDFVASLSGTLGWGTFGMREQTMEERWLASPPVGTAVYVDSGGGPGADQLCRDLDGDGQAEDDPDSADNYCESRQFVDALADSGFTWDEDLWHWWEPDAPHNEAAWAERVGMPLDLFLSLR